MMSQSCAKVAKALVVFLSEHVIRLIKNMLVINITNNINGIYTVKHFFLNESYLLHSLSSGFPHNIYRVLFLICEF